MESPTPTTTKEVGQASKERRFKHNILMDLAARLYDGEHPTRLSDLESDS
uniref:Uncharacterized protein n=1 Tax=Fagus sylvatica TaxID=28930 RepID=A0A2N9FP86_FAGSY